MKTDRDLDVLLEEINDLPAAELAALMQELAVLHAERLGLDNQDE
jgi:hypothetical protein